MDLSMIGHLSLSVDAGGKHYFFRQVKSDYNFKSNCRRCAIPVQSDREQMFLDHNEALSRSYYCGPCVHALADMCEQECMKK